VLASIDHEPTSLNESDAPVIIGLAPPDSLATLATTTRRLFAAGDIDASFVIDVNESCDP